MDPKPYEQIVAREGHDREEATHEELLVALSGYALPEDLQRAADAGFERHLAKPPSFEKLEEVLCTVTTRRVEA